MNVEMYYRVNISRLRTEYFNYPCSERLYSVNSIYVTCYTVSAKIATFNEAPHFSKIFFISPLIMYNIFSMNIRR